MKKITSALSLGALLVLSGCGQGTSGGPGATSPPSKADTVVQAGDTFSLSLSWTKLSQGETKEVQVDIKRGTNFSEDVFLRFTDLPKGISLSPDSPLIKHGEQAAKFKITAAADAALGDFTSVLIGHPTKGADSRLEVSVTVNAIETAGTTADAAKAKWAEYTASMQKQMEQLSVKYEELKERASKAEGQARADLDLKLAQSKTKLDVAAAKLEELKNASSERWEKIKEGVAAAFEDLKQSLA